MQRQNFKLHRSRNALLTILLILAIVAALSFVYRGLLFEIYFSSMQISVGLVINGVIAGLFMLGVIRIIYLLGHYSREEHAIAEFMENLDSRHRSELQNINENSIIARRYLDMSFMRQHGFSPDHAALSQVLVADENSRNSLPEFINNILILIGVFGTIISLSIALFGASNLLGDATNTDGINLVVHGMSTALSTTSTAIVCYILFRFFYAKLTGIQTWIISTVEHITTTYLAPRFRIRSENLTNELTDLVDSLHKVALQMQNAQKKENQLEDQILDAIDMHQATMREFNHKLSQVEATLARGFRLPQRDQ